MGFFNAFNWYILLSQSSSYSDLWAHFMTVKHWVINCKAYQNNFHISLSVLGCRSNIVM